MRMLYTAAIRAYGAGIQLAALWNAKAALWVEGRKAALPQMAGRPVWFHCASVGEFEQGRPLIEYMHARHPDVPILLSFFSPSGYTLRHNYPLATHVVYLPLDTPAAMERFVAHFNPRFALFVKYEIWHNCLKALSKRGISVVMASAKFRASQVYFKAWGGWFAKSLRHLHHIYTQDDESARLLRSIGLTQVSVAGDTRFDRVVSIATAAEGIPDIERFKGEANLLVAGSTWPVDEAALATWWKEGEAQLQDWKLVVVPHEPSAEHSARLMQQFAHCGTWSALSANSGGNSAGASLRVLVMDTVGMLSRLYRYADVAYVGGGFGVGIHNVLEPAVFGCPVVFGPRHQKFDEALGLAASGGGFAVRHTTELGSILDKLTSSTPARQDAGQAAAAFAKKGAGATSLIAKGLEELLSETA